MHQKEGTNDGIEAHWIYLRDGSRLSDLLKKETNVTLADASDEEIA